MKSMKKVFLRSKLAICLSAVLALTACDSDEQDQGTTSQSSVALTGVVIDGYLARATVFIDEDNNGTRDAWEPYAFTDNKGYYSYNPSSGINYCDSEIAEYQQYCLSTNKEYANAVIRIDGGYDVLTGQKFIGQLSRRIYGLENGETIDGVITPLTSLFTDIEIESERQSLLIALGLDTMDQLDIDYLNVDPSIADDTVDVELLNAAVKVHKIVTVISDNLTDTYDSIGNDFGTPNDATGSVYSSLAKKIIADRVNDDTKVIADILSDTESLRSVLNSARATLDGIYANKDISSESAQQIVNEDKTLSLALGINDVVDNLLDIDDDSFDLTEATGANRAIEVLISKAVNDDTISFNNELPTDIEDVIDLLESEDNAELDELLGNLASDNADVSALIRNDFDDISEVLDKSKIDDSVTPFSDLVNKSLKIQGDLNYGELTLSGDSEAVLTGVKDSEFEFFFSGVEGASSGVISVCAKFVDDAEIDSSGVLILGDGNTKGKLVKGFWSLLSPNAEGESYNLVVTLDFLGSNYSAQLKASGVNQYEFDFDGEVSTFDSDDVFVDFDGAIPSSDNDCQTRLPLRFDLL